MNLDTQWNTRSNTTRFLSEIKHLQLHFYCFIWKEKAKTWALCFIMGSNTSEQMKALGLQPHAFICFSVFGILHYVPGQMWCQVYFNLTSVKSQFPLAGQKIKNKPGLKRFNLKSNLTCNIYRVACVLTA